MKIIDENTVEVSGKIYVVSEPIETYIVNNEERGTCTGCIGKKSTQVCYNLPTYCSKYFRKDGKDVIWREG